MDFEGLFHGFKKNSKEDLDNDKSENKIENENFDHGIILIRLLKIVAFMKDAKKNHHISFARKKNHRSSFLNSFTSICDKCKITIQYSKFSDDFDISNQKNILEKDDLCDIFLSFNHICIPNYLGKKIRKKMDKMNEIEDKKDIIEKLGNLFEVMKNRYWEEIYECEDLTKFKSFEGELSIQSNQQAKFILDKFDINIYKCFYSVVEKIIENNYIPAIDYSKTIFFTQELEEDENDRSMEDIIDEYNDENISNISIIPFVPDQSNIDDSEIKKFQYYFNNLSTNKEVDLKKEKVFTDVFNKNEELDKTKQLTTDPLDETIALTNDREKRKKMFDLDKTMNLGKMDEEQRKQKFSIFKKEYRKISKDNFENYMDVDQRYTTGLPRAESSYITEIDRQIYHKILYEKGWNKYKVVKHMDTMDVPIIEFKDILRKELANEKYVSVIDVRRDKNAEFKIQYYYKDSLN